MAEKTGSTFAAFAHARFRKVWVATLVSQTGNWMQITGRAALIYDATGSKSALGLIYFLTYLPQLVLSQFAGVAVDRFDRRKVLVISQVAATLGTLAMGYLAVSETATVATVGAVSLFVGIAQAVMSPTQQALVPALVPKQDLASAITLTSATQAGTRVAGPLLAGVVYETLGLSWLFWLNAISFGIVIAIWVTTKVARQAAMAEKKTFEAIASGLKFVRSQPALIIALLTTVVIGGIGNMYQPLGLPFTTDILADGASKTGTRYYTYMQAALGAGAFFGILGVAKLASKRPTFAIRASALTISIALLVLAQMTVLGPTLVVSFIIGASHFAVNTLTLNVLQQRTPDEMRGRVLSLHQLGFVGTLPLISLAGNALADAFGVVAIFTGTGVICLAYCVVLLRYAGRLTTTTTETGPELARA